MCLYSGGLFALTLYVVVAVHSSLVLGCERNAYGALICTDVCIRFISLNIDEIFDISPAVSHDAATLTLEKVLLFAQTTSPPPG